MTDEIVETYVFEGVEVYLTGRVATKAQKPGSNHTEPQRLFEIKPVDKSFDYVKWVRPTDLFKVSKVDT